MFFFDYPVSNCHTAAYKPQIGCCPLSHPSSYSPYLPPPPAMSTSRSELKVDMTQPASSILRAGTLKIHNEISKSKTAIHLTKGELSREEYVRYLMILWHIYKYARFLHLFLTARALTSCDDRSGCSKRVWPPMPTTASCHQHTILPCSPAAQPSPQIYPLY